MKMRPYLLLFFLFGILACSKESTEPAGPDKPIVGNIVAPSKLTAVQSGTSVLLTWEDNSDNEEGFIVSRMQKLVDTEYKKVKTTGPDEIQYSDAGIAPGDYLYKIEAFKEDQRSTAAQCAYTHIKVEGLPVIKITKHDVTYARVHVQTILEADNNGEYFTLGVCWGTNPNPTKENAFWENPNLSVQKGKKVSLVVSNMLMNYDQKYYLRAYARNSLKTVYSEEVSFTMKSADQPKPLHLPWTKNTTYSSALPAEVQIYETSEKLNGRAFKAYYAIADLSTGNVEFKASCLPIVNVAGHFKAMGDKALVMVNGGYFDIGNTNLSTSLLIQDGVVKAHNRFMRTVTYGDGTYETYGFTLPAIGVTKSGKLELRYTQGSKTELTCPYPTYNHPTLNVLGYPWFPWPTDNFPHKIAKWDVSQAAGGGPTLLKDGKVVFDNSKIDIADSRTAKAEWMTNYELFANDLFLGYLQPRTAIGFTADNKMILFVCEGRDAGVSEGCYLDEEARIMMALGCTNAISLDGGGSSTMISLPNATLVNKVLGGTWQRPVPTAVGFFKK